MKYAFAIILSVSFAVYVHGQQLAPWVIASTGGFSSNGTNSVSYTVGEMTMVQTFSAGSAILTQGFQQPNDLFTGLRDIESDNSLTIYPNPTIDVLWFDFESSHSGAVSVSIRNLLGQTVPVGYEGEFPPGKNTNMLSVSGLPAGMYFFTALLSQSGKEQQRITQRFEVVR
jgi:hypothetical protein